MDVTTLERIRVELEPVLTGQKLGKVFQLSRFELAVDFRLPDSRYLFISVEPANPRIYLMRRRLKDLERMSAHPSAFSVFLRKRLSGAVLHGIDRLPGERVLSFDFTVRDELGETHRYYLIIQLTGRSANLFLLDANRTILDASRENLGEGQVIGDLYAPPFRDDDPRRKGDAATRRRGVEQKATEESLSESLDGFYLEKDEEKRFQSLTNSARTKLKQEISKRTKLTENLNKDLAGHGDAEIWKRFGDLLLANVANARREGNKIFVTDYYDENLAEIAVDVDADTPITEAAEKFFKRYTKARNAGEEIVKRLKIIKSELEKLHLRKARLDEAVIAKDEDYLREIITDRSRKPSEIRRGKAAETNSGARSFISSDGFEILVGKKARDNDYLTFRVAKSLDLWMHAADYPGSHVVVRNPNRKEIPQKTLLEAAQLAAFYSQGKSQPKAAVHYTQKKFVNKPKGAAAGLVSLASFKTILVKPEFPALGEPRAANIS